MYVKIKMNCKSVISWVFYKKKFNRGLEVVNDQTIYHIDEGYVMVESTYVNVLN